MAVYKVLQDIEAEDKLVGPLTLKQFIFAIIAVVLIGLSVFLGRINVALAIPFIVPIIFFGFMASPIGRDQPNDVWLAARIRFLIKPRKRHWDQSGMQELVTITAPKRVDIQRTNDLDQTQVKSRLNALASTLDSRGWAVKNINVNMGDPNYVASSNETDRLINISAIQKEEPVVDVRADDDILDPMNNTVARRFDTAIKQKHQEKVAELRNFSKEEPQPAPLDYSFITSPAVEPGYTTFGAQVVAPTTKKTQGDSESNDYAKNASIDDEAGFLERQHRKKAIDKQIAKHGHEKVILPLSEQEAEEPPVTTKAAPEVPAAPSQLRPVPLPQQLQPTVAVPPLQAPIVGQSTAMGPGYPVQSQYAQAPIAPPVSQVQKAPDDILEELGQSNDLSVASLASLAKHAEREASLHDNDVISLH